jgi:hypothetical protein
VVTTDGFFKDYLTWPLCHQGADDTCYMFWYLFQIPQVCFDGFFLFLLSLCYSDWVTSSILSSTSLILSPFSPVWCWLCPLNILFQVLRLFYFVCLAYHCRQIPGFFSFMSGLNEPNGKPLSFVFPRFRGSTFISPPSLVLCISCT